MSLTPRANSPHFAVPERWRAHSPGAKIRIKNGGVSLTKLDISHQPIFHTSPIGAGLIFFLDEFYYNTQLKTWYFEIVPLTERHFKWDQRQSSSHPRLLAWSLKVVICLVSGSYSHLTFGCLGKHILKAKHAHSESYSHVLFLSNK